MYINLTGKKFGRLTVINKIGKDKRRNILWSCKCICGRKTIVASSQLKNGHVRLCGCLQKEKAYEYNKNDIKGYIFNRLTVIEETTDRDISGNILWKCICSCGNEIVVSGSSLRNGATKSCGCLNRELFLKRAYKHGLSNTKAYKAEAAMRRLAKKQNQTPSNANLEEIHKIYKICSDMNDRAKQVMLPKIPHNGAWFHVDHIQPISNGGLHHQENLQILWWIDNLKKRR